ncbi:MAG: ATP-binding protein [Candidatus Methylomirabilia bacterium]
MTRSPFSIGLPVTGADLADRDTELETILKEALAGSRLFLISPRRYGKTSLLLEARTRLLARRIPVAYVDLYQATSLAHFLDLFARAVLEATEGTVQRAMRIAGELLRATRPTMTVNAQGQVEWTMGFSQQQADLLRQRDQVLALPESLAERKKSRLAVFIDEFQEIRALDGPALEKALRAALQQQPRVSYVFAGSKESLMWEMVRARRSPFFRSGPTLSLGPIPPGDFKRHLSAKFRSTGMGIVPDRLDEILALSDDVPFNVQYLCHALWIVKDEKGQVSSADVGRAMEYVLAAEGECYGTLWDQLSLHQRRTIRGVARSGGASPFAAAFLREHDLGPSASVARSLAQLIKREVLKRAEAGYRFADPFFKAWVLSRMP